MNLRQKIELGLDSLDRFSGAQIDSWQPASPLDVDEIAAVEALGATIPVGLKDLLAPMNGCSLEWHISGETTAGSLHLPPLRSMILGWSEPPGGAPGEGVFWNRSQSAVVQTRLCTLRVLESISGDSRTIAFDPANADLLFLVDDENIMPLTPRRDEAMMALASVLGVHGAREALTTIDWQARLAALPFTARITGATKE